MATNHVADAVELLAVRKTFGQAVAVDDVSLTVRRGEFLTLLGPSGCGKTTTLNMIAGFLTPDAGTITLAGRPMQEVPPYHRDIGLVFQDYALFPHRSVAENVAFGLRMRRVNRAEIARRVRAALALVKLDGLADRRPQALSGGQRQRVALARALVIDPTVLLLDEPLSNLDLKLRETMRLEITELQRRTGVTTILVTHDQSEALVMSDRVAVMNRGRVEQVGDPRAIYETPASRFVAEFIGTMNFIPATATAGGVSVGGQNVSAIMPHKIPSGDPALLAFRPERCRLGPGELALTGTVTQQVYLGNKTELHVQSDIGGLLIVDAAGALPPVGASVTISVQATDCLAYAAEQR